MSTLTIGELRTLVSTGVSDLLLQPIIDREELEIDRRLGPVSDGIAPPIVETKPGSTRNIFLRRPIVSVSLVREQQILGSSFSTLLTSQYQVWKDEGRLERLPAVGGAPPSWFGGDIWGPLVEVTYIAVDDRERRKLAIVEFVRIALERTAMQSENVAGEYSYQAPEWDVLRARLYRSIGFWEV